MAVGSRPLVPSRLAPGGVAHGVRHTPTTVVGAYIALTKPRIIELLLITTVPTMVLAETGLARHLARADHAARRHARRRRGERRQHVRRSRHRRPDGPHPGPPARHGRHPGPQRARVRPRAAGAGVRRALGRRQPAVGRARLRCRRLLRRGLHALAEAHEPPEHRDRRCGRRRAGARRMGRRAGLARLDADPAVPRHVPVDPAALLGARRQVRRRLPGRRRPDAAGGRPASRRSCAR